MSQVKTTDEHAERKVPDEPEQMLLWRRIIERRETLAQYVREWEEFRAKQRAGLDPLEEMPDDHRESEIEMRDRGEALIDGTVDAALERIEQLDQAIRAGTKGTSTQGRGLNLRQLKELGDRDDAKEGRRDVAILYVTIYLRGRSGFYHGLNRRSAEAVLRDFTGSESIDLDTLEQRARAERKRKAASGRLKDLAARIVDLANGAE